MSVYGHMISLALSFPVSGGSQHNTPRLVTQARQNITVCGKYLECMSHISNLRLEAMSRGAIGGMRSCVPRSVGTYQHLAAIAP
jgi:hypothetical protein